MSQKSPPFVTLPHRPSRSTARKSIPSNSPPFSIKTPPLNSTLRINNATTSHTPPENSKKTLVSSSDIAKSDVCIGNNVDDNADGVTTTSVAPEKAIIHVEPQIGHVKDNENSVEADSGAGSGKGKRKIVKKTVRVVKRVIKKRVPKIRVLNNGSEDLGLVENAENSAINAASEVTDSDHVNDLIEKPDLVDHVIGKIGVVDEVKEISNQAVDVVTQHSNDATEEHSLFDEKSNIVDEVKGVLELDGSTRESIVDGEGSDVGGVYSMEKETPKLSCGAAVSEPMIGEKGNDLSGVDSTETKISTITVGARVPASMVGEECNDQSNIYSMEMDNIKNDDVMTEVDRKDLNTHTLDSMEVDTVNFTAKTTIESERTGGIEGSATENLLKDSVIENHSMVVVSNDVMGLVTDQDLDPVEEKNVVLVQEKNESLGKSESVSLNELLLSGEMEALERRKRRRTEVFVGGLDNKTKEDDIRKAFEGVGTILEVRLVMNNTGKNRGYAFLRFATAADAKNALAKYSKVEICGKQCDAAPVEGNDTIFLGNIDRKWKNEDVVQLLKKAGINNIDKVTVKADPKNIERNRGFAFVELETSRFAQKAFDTLQKKNVFGNQVKVAWAQPLIEPAEEEILKVKTVYAEYLPSSWDEGKVREYFERFGEIENVVLAKDLSSSKRNDYAFIKYTNRDAALACIETVSRERSEDDGSKVKIAVSLAKPISRSRQMKHASVPTSKQLSKEKPKPSQATIKPHEPRKSWKPASSSYHHAKVDTRSSTTDELVQLLRQQASSNHIHVYPNRGPTLQGEHFPSRGSKRPFPVGHDPLYLEPVRLLRPRTESFYPVSGPSALSHGFRTTSYQQQGIHFTSDFPEPVNRRNYSSHFQVGEQTPNYGNNNIYRRY